MIRMRPNRWPVAGVLLALVVVALIWAPSASAASAVPGNCVAAPTRALIVDTVPKVVGFTFDVGGLPYTTDSSGSVQIAGLSCSDPDGALQVPSGVINQGGGTAAAFDSWHREKILESAGGSGTIYASFRQRTLVTFDLVDLQGNPVPRSDVGHIRIKGSTGAVVWVPPGRTSVMLDSSRVVGPADALISKDILWSVQRVRINGNTAVNRGEVRFAPRKSRVVRVQLMLYPLRVTVHDAILGRPVGTDVSVVSPNGTVQTVRLGPGATGEVPALSRGRYILRAGGGSIAISFRQPVAVSRAQVAHLTVVSYLDVALAGAVILVVVLGLFLVGRTLRLRAQARRGPPGPRSAPTGSPQPGPDHQRPEARGPTEPPPEDRREVTRS